MRKVGSLGVRILDLIEKSTEKPTIKYVTSKSPKRRLKQLRQPRGVWQRTWALMFLGSEGELYGSSQSVFC